jgi:hypothetical protein
MKKKLREEIIMDKLEKVIINQLVGIKDLTDYAKEGEKRFYVTDGDEYSKRYCLTQTVIDGIKFIKIWCVEEEDVPEVIGYIRIYSTWKYGDYAEIITKMIRTYM